jgi:hypothetical protein
VTPSVRGEGRGRNQQLGLGLSAWAGAGSDPGPFFKFPFCRGPCRNVPSVIRLGIDGPPDLCNFQQAEGFAGLSVRARWPRNLAAVQRMLQTLALAGTSCIVRGLVLGWPPQSEKAHPPSQAFIFISTNGYLLRDGGQPTILRTARSYPIPGHAAVMPILRAVSSTRASRL